MNVITMIFRKPFPKRSDQLMTDAAVEQGKNGGGQQGWTAKTIIQGIKVILLWGALITLLGGGIAWLFSIKESADEAVRMAGEAKTDVQQVKTQMQEITLQVQQMKLQTHEDLMDIKRELRYLRGDSTDVTVRRVKPPGTQPIPQIAK